jgi:hypothetical protein
MMSRLALGRTAGRLCRFFQPSTDHLHIDTDTSTSTHRRRHPLGSLRKMIRASGLTGPIPDDASPSWEADTPVPCTASGTGTGTGTGIALIARQPSGMRQRARPAAVSRETFVS